MARQAALSRVFPRLARCSGFLSTNTAPRMSTTATSGLFRREVLEARRNDFLGIIEIGPARYGRTFAGCALACVAAIACFITFARYTRHERVEGQLVPSAGLLELSAPSTGTITRCLVREGEQVVEGQPIAEVRAALDSIALGDTRALIDERLREQLAALDSDMCSRGRWCQTRACLQHRRSMPHPARAKRGGGCAAAMPKEARRTSASRRRT